MGREVGGKIRSDGIARKHTQVTHNTRQTTYRKTTESFGMNGTLMNKDIGRSIVGNDKAKALFGVKPLDRAVLHGGKSAETT